MEVAFIILLIMIVKKLIKSQIRKLPYIRGLYNNIDQLNRKIECIESEKKMNEKQEIFSKFAPSGHFYSPLPNLSEIEKRTDKIFDCIPANIPGVNLNVEEQLKYFENFRKYYKDIPFDDLAQEGLRYFFNNPAYPCGDAISLYCMIRHIKPKKIIEIGSGYSSCVILDTNDLNFGGSIDCTFIEPYPELLLSLIKESDKEKIKIMAKNIQDINPAIFLELQKGDILFIDSTHVSKVDSDVNHIFFNILPTLKKGVFIHFHDIFYPFEYPKEWIFQGIAWNESYLLRAFLQYNDSFKIVFFNNYIFKTNRNLYLNNMPLYLKNSGGSIWIEKI